MKKLILITIVLLHTLYTCAQELKGRVEDDKREPMWGAAVILFRNSAYIGGTLTDLDGLYKIGSLKEGYYDEFILHYGFDTFQRKVHVHKDSIRVILTNMIKSKTQGSLFNQPFLVVGSIADIHNNKVPYSTIQFVNKKYKQCVTSDSSGLFTVLLPDLYYTVRIVSKGYKIRRTLVNKFKTHYISPLYEARNCEVTVTVKRKLIYQILP